MINKKIEGNYEIIETANAKITKNINTVVKQHKEPKIPEPTNAEIKELLLEILDKLNVKK